MDEERERDPARSAVHPERKFIPLGAPTKLATKRQFPGTGSAGHGSEVVTASFMLVDKKNRAPTKLPDIFTTCPELRHFKPIIAIPGVSALNPDAQAKDEKSDGKFDPEKPILRPYVSPFRMFTF